MRIPKDLERHLPDLLWFFQMGAIYFWVLDESPHQANSDRLLAIAARSIVDSDSAFGAPSDAAPTQSRARSDPDREGNELIGAAMVTLKEVTVIRAPIARCFDLARSVEAHLAGNVHWGEAAVAAAGITSGLIELGQHVTWRAKHFAIWQRSTSEITAMDRPVYFQDTMIDGPFTPCSTITCSGCCLPT